MMLLRPAHRNDAAAIFELATAFASTFSVERTAFDASLTALLETPGAFLFVADDSGQLVGYLLGFDHHTFFANGRVAWVEEIMVAEEMRRQGIGRRLMEAFEDWSRSRGSRLIALATRRAAPFYCRLGYRDSAAYFRKLL